MKRTLLSILSIFCLLPLSQAQEHLSERVYLSTDKNVYVAGDDMFISAFCIDMAVNNLSNGSAIAYLEICSTDGPVQTGKIALQKGRGGGVVSLLNTIPTGNYRLVAYTSQCFNESGYDFQECSRQITIINPFTTERSGGGVEIIEDSDYAAIEPEPVPSAGSLKYELKDGGIIITNTSDKSVSASVSVFNDDGIVSPSSSNIVTFKTNVSKGEDFIAARTLDYEGEVIRARVRGSIADDKANATGGVAFLAIPGRVSDIYSSKIDEYGVATFYTRNIYGNADVFLEMSSKNPDCHLDIESPFKGVRATGLDRLQMSRGLERDILQRSIAMQMQKAMGADSLYEILKMPEDILLEGDAIEYKLDDYTRFPLMEELFIEFVHELKTDKTEDGPQLVVLLQDSYRPSPFSQIPALVLLDGVPVLDHSRIYAYDPLLVEKIVIYPYTYNLGDWYYSGVVDFVTYKRNLPSYEFEESVRIVDFQGVSYPVASYMPTGDAEHPDMRQTILWHPLVEIGPGESRELNYSLPSYKGKFKFVVEGLNSSCEPQYITGFLENNN